MRIGFIGLGVMGKPMAKNLLAAGHELTALDHYPENEALLRDAGASIASTPKDVATACETIITMLPNSPSVREAVCGEDGILAGAVAGSLVIDMSSIAPGAAREIAVACRTKGMDMLDAPVSGGEPKAIDGTLSIMATGHQAGAPLPLAAQVMEIVQLLRANGRGGDDHSGLAILRHACGTRDR